jgi:hypothetical protein
MLRHAHTYVKGGLRTFAEAMADEIAAFKSTVALDV